MVDVISQVAYENGKIRQIYSPDEIRNHFDPCSLLIPKIETQLEQFWEVISNFRRTDTFLIFAEKEFLKETFPNYIPASIKDWDKTNRPWDYDHIIPQSWSAYRSRSEPFKEIADYWLWRTGNFAAIPFEENRSKNAYSEYAFYEKNTRTLLFSKEFEKVHAEFLREEEQAKVFAQAVFDRTISIYEHCFNYIAPCLKSNAKKQNL